MKIKGGGNKAQFKRILAKEIGLSLHL